LIVTNAHVWCALNRQSPVQKRCGVGLSRVCCFLSVVAACVLPRVEPGHPRVRLPVHAPGLQRHFSVGVQPGTRARVWCARPVQPGTRACVWCVRPGAHLPVSPPPQSPCHALFLAALGAAVNRARSFSGTSSCGLATMPLPRGDTVTGAKWRAPRRALLLSAIKEACVSACCLPSVVQVRRNWRAAASRRHHRWQHCARCVRVAGFTHPPTPPPPPPPHTHTPLSPPPPPPARHCPAIPACVRLTHTHIYMHTPVLAPCSSSAHPYTLVSTRLAYGWDRAFVSNDLTAFASSGGAGSRKV
jgi:hypothetical protein